MARWAVTAFTFFFGVVHLLGSASAFGFGGTGWMSGEMLVGETLEPRHPGLVLAGVLCLLTGAGFITAGVAAALGHRAWKLLATVAALLSLIPGFFWAPGGRWIVVVSVAVVLVLAAAGDRIDDLLPVRPRVGDGNGNPSSA